MVMVPESDHLTFLNVYQQWEYHGYSSDWSSEHFDQFFSHVVTLFLRCPFGRIKIEGTETVTIPSDFNRRTTLAK